jgi:hypothetical protein
MSAKRSVSTDREKRCSFISSDVGHILFVMKEEMAWFEIPL